MKLEGEEMASAGSVTVVVASDESIEGCCERRTMAANMMISVVKMIVRREGVK